ncbi:winged helix-turn-helix transcriptional regulator [Pectinatus frisingensis]|uniref:winged helix-turn-helix transcriptional regulator n=1 Tax=Pectinatus frisingensis TaxID=865 RepID=UPI0018C52872|nr:helix-turn-helix domain-containing protein [Pectinatus frisingensis]
MEECYVRYAMGVIGGKWKLLIVWTISQNGVIRFNDLQRKVDGISSLMLSKNLKELEQELLIIRHQYNEIPPRVEYELSELGQKLIIALNFLNEWGCEVYTYKNRLSIKKSTTSI